MHVCVPAGMHSYIDVHTHVPACVHLCRYAYTCMCPARVCSCMDAYTCVHMHGCTCVHIHTGMLMCVYTRVHACVHSCIYSHMCLLMQVCTCVRDECMQAHTCACMCACMCVCSCICMHACADVRVCTRMCVLHTCARACMCMHVCACSHKWRGERIKVLSSCLLLVQLFCKQWCPLRRPFEHWRGEGFACKRALETRLRQDGTVG